MKIPPCKVCGVSLKHDGPEHGRRVLISQKGKRDKPKGYCWDHAPKWDAQYAEMVEYDSPRYHDLPPCS